MPRSITKSMSGILEDMELDNKEYVTNEELWRLAQKHGIGTDVAMIAQRLKNAGWLIPTMQRGVWEFASASMAGAYSKNDPLRDVKAFKLSNPDIPCFICLQTAAWAMGLADRTPVRKELAFTDIPRKSIPETVVPYKYSPAIPLKKVRGVEALAPESIVVQLETRPSVVKSWDAVMEWLPDVVYDTEIEVILAEIAERSDSIKRRTGYLLQGMFPDAADAIYQSIFKPSPKIRFGSRTKAIRNDEKWKISDTELPFSPKEMERVK